MKLSEIRKLKECPEWLKCGDISVKNEYIYIINDMVVWQSGTWQSGTWKSGIWESGIWESGTWKSGFWQDGFWQDGIWESGTWKSGFWQDGMKSIGQCKWSVYYNHKKQTILIGCKTKTVSEWNEWFNSKDEYETKRNTAEFKKIFMSFKFAEAVINIENKEYLYD